MSDQGQRMDEQVLNALALSVERVEPPPALRQRVLTAARRPAPMRLPLAAVAAIAVVALLAGLLMGNALRAAPPQSGPQVSHFTLAGSGAASNVTGDVTYVKGQVAIIHFTDLPAVEPGRVYELWLITAGNHADAAGVFTPDARGEAQIVVNRSLGGYKLMAVTVEAGPTGVSAPTQAPELSGNIVYASSDSN